MKERAAAPAPPLASPLPLPTVIGHRGAAASAPENTLAGLRRAKALGCSWVEFDVRLTGDGVLVVCHDSRLDRTTDATGRIAAAPLSSIRRADAGTWFSPRFAGETIPTLDEALDLTAELGLGANIEIKADRGLARATAAAVANTLARQKAHSGRILVSSFVRPSLAAMQELAPNIPRGLLLRRFPIRWRRLSAQLGCATLHLDHRSLQPALVAAVRRAGYPLLAYTVNDTARARLLFDWGVTSVFSDVPDIILQAMAERLPSMAAAGVSGSPLLPQGVLE